MNKEILRLAIPNIISNISVPLISTVDVALMGGLSTTHLAALGLATMIFNFLLWNFGFLRMGTTGLVAQSYGAGDTVKCQQLLRMSLVLATVLSVGILVLQFFMLQGAEMALGISEEHISLVATYFYLRVWSAPAALATYALYGWLFGMQDAIRPLLVTILVNVTNILCSYHLVVHHGWGIQGAALGTVIAEYIGLIALLVIVTLRYRVPLFRFDLDLDWRQFFAVNKDLFIRTVALTGAFLYFYRQSSLAGGLVLAVNVILLQFLSWISYGIDGFAYACESLVGKYKGAKDLVGLKRVIRYSFGWAGVLSLMIGLIFYGWHLDVARIFTDDVEVLADLSFFRVELLLLPILAFACYIWDGVFIGLAASRVMRDTMIIGLLLYVLLFHLIDGQVHNAIWYSFMAFLTLRGLLLSRVGYGMLIGDGDFLRDS